MIRFFFAPKRFRRCVHAWLKLGYFFKKKKARIEHGCEWQFEETEDEARVESGPIAI